MLLLLFSMCLETAAATAIGKLSITYREVVDCNRGVASRLQHAGPVRNATLHSLPVRPGGRVGRG